MTSKVALLPKCIDSSAKIVTLTHPLTAKPTSFVIQNEKIYEVLSIDRPHASWFLGNTCVSDGSCFCITDMHPVFMILPFLRSRGKEMVSLDSFFDGSEYADLASIFIPHLDRVCKSMDLGDGPMYYYDEEKTMAFLVEKTERLLPFFREQNPTYDDKLLIEMAFDAIRHFVKIDFSEGLQGCLKKKYPGSFPPKQMEMVDTTIVEPETKRKPTKKTAPKQKLKKPENNMSISSFFAPKPSTK